MRNLTTTEAIARLDADVLKELKTMQRQGRNFVRAGEIARKMSCDSVQALGAMERVKYRL